MNRAFKSYPFSAQRYDAVLPQLKDGIESRRHPVVIVGGGPVGLCAALGLAQHGIASVLLEADDSVCTGSRATCISRRSLEIIERLGALDGFLRVGLPWTGGRSFYREAEVLHFKMPQDQDQKLPPMVNLPQYQIEQFLLDAAQRHADLIDIRWQTKVTAIATHAEGATLSLAVPDGRSYQLQADWVVACDGGRSTIREAMGLRMQGTNYEGRYVIVDVHLKSDRPTERLAYFDPPSNPGSTVLVHKQPGDVWRIDYQLRDDEDAEQAVKPENVMPRVQSLLEMMGERADWSPIWISLYKANALTLEHYRHGRVLFAGDAAHLVPIFGVRGANSGIDDADNLAWKLAYVIAGRASTQLLDSYSAERVFAAHENLSYGIRSTEFMTPPSFAFELFRKAVLGLAVKHQQVRSLINPRQTSAISYTDSQLNIGDQPDNVFAAGPVPGAVLPECSLALIENGAPRKAHLTDVLGPHFTVLYFSEQGGIPAGWAEFKSAPTIPLKLVPLTRKPSTGTKAVHGWDYSGRLFPMYDALPGTLYLIRPDGHVLGRWRSANAAIVASAIESALSNEWRST